jgi:hypothetical protein
MNLVDLVTSQLTGDVLGKLAGLTGTNESQTRSATSAAVPALLTAFAKLASTNSGASTLASSLGGLDLKMLGNLAGLLGGSQASGLGSIGGSLLSSLLGNNLGGLVGTIASFAGMQPGIMKTLLTYLAPIVLGTIANSFKGAKPDAAGLMSLFSEQKDNIKAALPRGLSLADFDTTAASPRRGEETRGVHRHEEPASGFPSWLPLLLLPLLGLVGWALWPKPAPRAVVLKGECAENGKSQVLDLARGILPATAVCTITPARLGDERHIVALAGKLLNASDELSSATAVASEVFKAVITGEPVEGRDVYKSRVEFRPIAQHLFATNTTRVAIKRGAYLRGYVFDFIRTFAPTLTPELVQRALASPAGERFDI